ncbi:hypothetical protein AB0G35_15875 [Streptomyces sp. NPDC021749]|uniref:hypothetical protein n=1 Tax=Streptomyces sp. NPDC021749 TaxID=3154905 RepID=UPI0033C7EABD
MSADREFEHDHERHHDQERRREYEQWRTRTVRCPGDVPVTTPLSWMAEKHFAHGERLADRRLPAAYRGPEERGDAGDALAQLALGVRIARAVEQYRAETLHEALQLGATWSQIAAALDVGTDEARGILRSHANGQLRLYESEHSGGAGLLGMNPEQHRAAMALTDLGDDEPAPATASVA